MATEPPKPSATTAHPSADRLWAEQLAMGGGLLLAVLGYMAISQPKMLASGVQVFSSNYLAAYGWWSVGGVIFLLVIHEIGALAVAHHYKLPLKFRLFPFGVNAAAILTAQPRRAWIDAAVGLAGPVTGTLVSFILAGIYQFTCSDANPSGDPFLLGMACVGYFYNLFTLIPILELEGGWVAPALAPQAWLLGLVACIVLLTQTFNLFLLAVVVFGVPRFILLLRARAPREDLNCTNLQRGIVAVVYFAIVLLLAHFGSSTYEALARLVPEAMGD
jgi:Zn-dependent protease